MAALWHLYKRGGNIKKTTCALCMSRFPSTQHAKLQLGGRRYAIG